MIGYLFNFLCIWIIGFLWKCRHGSKLYGMNTLSGSALQRCCPCLMHLAFDFCSVVNVSIIPEALSFPDMVNVEICPFVYLARENSDLQKPLRK